MDRIESLTNTLSNITLYDIKSMYNQAKNVVLNVSEMEAKVREATNEDPWGASSTLMQDIAQGTFHFQYFNEIMPCIYSRFMEKEARQWRQIYKALQLLEYLIKHGSERVVDDARSHISTLKMLRNFHYIDEKGKDEGVNVRNRARELVELLSDVEKIRSERRKAKANRTKYTGVGNDGLSLSYESGGGRYGGFGGDSLGSPYNGSYGNDDNSGGGNSRTGGGGSSFSDNRRQYEEYDAGDDELSHTPARSNSARNPTRKSSGPPPPAATSQPEVDLLGGFDDTPETTSALGPVGNLARNKALPSVEDDDFADFQAAPVQAGQASAPSGQANKPTLMDIIGSNPVPTAQVKPGLTAPQGRSTTEMTTGLSGHRPQLSFSSTPQLTPISAQPQPSLNLFGNSAVPLRPTPIVMGSATPGGPANPNTDKRPTAPPVKSSSNFDDLWNLSLGSTSTATLVAGAGKSIKDLEKEKATAGLWGTGQRAAGTSNIPKPAAFGTFSTAQPSGGMDDLLL